MAWFTALTALVGPVANAVSTWQSRKAQVAHAKHEAKLERIRSQAGDWKDEFLIVLWSYPMISIFLPFDVIQQSALDGLEKVGQLPQWYLGGWIAISLAVFGADKILKIKKE